MISVLLIWLYMVLTAGMTGLLLAILAKKILSYNVNSIVSILITGIVGVTVYAQIYSLFGAVSLVSNVILVTALIILGAIFRKECGETIIKICNNVRSDKVKFYIVIILIILMSYGTSHGIMHYDTGLYHAQAIHWIEQYGIVPGLGNLHVRLGYNSAAFPLNALYSFAFLGGQSFHVTAGFCALLLALECMGIVDNIRKKEITVPLFARLAAIYYLFIIFDEMVSPASDYYMVTIAFVFIIKWLDSIYATDLEENEKTAIWCMLAILTVFIASIKLSGATLVVFAIIPGYRLIRKKEWGKFFGCIVTGFITILPYLIRNVVISGWLLYPSTSIDLFSFDWKVPRGIAEYDYKEIQVYGRGITDVSRFEDSCVTWFPDWFKSQAIFDRLFIVAAIVGMMYFVVKCLYYGFILCRDKKLQGMGQQLFSEGAICVAFCFWMMTSPLMRYGCLYVYLTVAIIWGGIAVRLSQKKNMCRFIVVIICVFMSYKTAMFGIEVIRNFNTVSLVAQQDYETFTVESYQIGDKTFYAPVEGDRTGYYAFPSSPWVMDINLRGNSIKSGFMAKE